MRQGKAAGRNYKRKAPECKDERHDEQKHTGWFVQKKTKHSQCWRVFKKKKGSDEVASQARAPEICWLELGHLSRGETWRWLSAGPSGDRRGRPCPRSLSPGCAPFARNGPIPCHSAHCCVSKRSGASMRLTAKSGHVITAWEPMSLHLSTLHHEYPPTSPPAEVKMKQSFLSSVGEKKNNSNLAHDTDRMLI